LTYRVWILGAGFSRSLGAPLLHDLLSLAARSRLYAEYRDIFRREDADPVFELYHFGRGFSEGPLNPLASATTRGGLLWRDAEHFLAFLDEAVRRPPLEDQLNDIWAQINAHRKDSPVDRLPAWVLRATALRIVAASCSSFLEGVDSSNLGEFESWRPYEAWMRHLGGDDVLISFNYDRVVECLGRAVADDGVSRSGGVHVVLPTVGNSPGTSDAEVGKTLLIKLHGSVDWEMKEIEGICAQPWSRDLLQPPHSLALGIPGRSKQSLASKFFSQLWELAAERISAAHEIYFLGYRFPESDSAARETLLDAIASNRNGPTIRTILGPGVQDPQSIRLAQLLQWTTGSGYVDSTPLWVEDFLSVWARRLRAETQL
jgi:hypothetical protein